MDAMHIGSNIRRIVFVQILIQVTEGPLHEPYEKPNSPMISEKSSTKSFRHTLEN